VQADGPLELVEFIYESDKNCQAYMDNSRLETTRSVMSHVDTFHTETCTDLSSQDEKCRVYLTRSVTIDEKLSSDA